jgi:hypothetical protein
MNNVFEAIDKFDRKIRLTKKQWEHIRKDHPDVEGEEIRQTVLESFKIMRGERERYFYYKYFKYKKSPARFLRVIVKYLNGDGFIMTSYFVKDIK